MIANMRLQADGLKPSAPGHPEARPSREEQ
jgi:hypothetical protein